MDLKNLPYKVEGEVLAFGRCRCAVCGKKGKLGKTTEPTQQYQVVRIYCADCTVAEIAAQKKISVKEAEDLHERSQKTQELLIKMILERYKETTGKKPPKDMEGLTELMQPGMTWWRQQVSDSEKDRIAHLSKDEQKELLAKAPLLAQPKVPIINENPTGRNDPCPCGSGKKHKKCCLLKAA